LTGLEYNRDGRTGSFDPSLFEHWRWGGVGQAHHEGVGTWDLGGFGVVDCAREGRDILSATLPQVEEQSGDWEPNFPISSYLATKLETTRMYTLGSSGDNDSSESCPPNVVSSHELNGSEVRAPRLLNSISEASGSSVVKELGTPR